MIETRLVHVRGIGGVFERRLQEAGITSVKELLAADRVTLSGVLGASEQRVAAIQAAARELAGDAAEVQEPQAGPAPGPELSVSVAARPVEPLPIPESPAQEAGAPGNTGAAVASKQTRKKSKDEKKSKKKDAKKKKKREESKKDKKKKKKKKEKKAKKEKKKSKTKKDGKKKSKADKKKKKAKSKKGK